jgi:phosphohistidine swiveling domain-containing protein
MYEIPSLTATVAVDDVVWAKLATRIASPALATVKLIVAVVPENAALTSDPTATGVVHDVPVVNPINVGGNACATDARVVSVNAIRIVSNRFISGHAGAGHHRP